MGGVNFTFVSREGANKAIGITFKGDAYYILVNEIELLFDVEWACYTGAAGT